MALKKQFDTLSAFSMSSMADVIFLLLIFFMITSTLIIPSALDVNLPQSTEQTIEKPQTEVYIDSLSQLYIVADRNDSLPEGRVPRQVSAAELQSSLMLMRDQGILQSVALYADTGGPYGHQVVLATRPASSI